MMAPIKGETEQPASICVFLGAVIMPEALGGCQPMGTGLPTT